MAAARRPRDPLAIESPAARRERARRLDEALRRGALAGYFGALFRRDILTERLVSGIQIDLGVLFARQVEAPVIGAVAALLSSREATEPFPVREGVPAIPPPPIAIPPQLGQTVDRVIAAGGPRVLSALQSEMGELATQEVAFTAKAMVRHFGAPALPPSELAGVEPRGGPEPATGALLPPAADQVGQTIVRRAETAPMFGQVVERVWGKSLDGLRDRVQAKVGEAMQRGASNDEIVRLLRGTRAQQYRDGLLGAWRANSLRMFVRTVATHIVTQTREATYGAMGVPYVQLIATLDLRTTPQCIELDHTIWPIGEGPRPPIHPGCRTAVAPAWAAVSDDDPKFGGKRASKDGPVPSWWNAKKWWDQLSADDQDEHVGPLRAAALRSGRLRWDQLFGPGLEPLSNRDLRARGLLSA